MREQLTKIYNKQRSKKTELLNLKNRYFAEIYNCVLTHKKAREIHKRLFEMTINSKVMDKRLLNMMIKLTNKATKLDKGAGAYYSIGLDVLAVALLDLFDKQEVNKKAKKIINHDLMEETEEQKQQEIVNYMQNNRNNGVFFYLASSHNDCAKDHIPYQGKMYVDRQWRYEATNKAAIGKYVRDHDVKTIQRVMGKPAWFITRPYCRHYFVAIPTEQVIKKSLKKLKKKYKTHIEEGNREFQTPATAAIEEYEDRLKMLEYLYSKYKTDELKNKILKTKMLLRKWKNYVQNAQKAV